MAAHRAQWKGHLKIGELSCAVGLYTAASTSERISFHMINESTGNRLKREFIDSETEEVVERDQQVKGFETGNGDYIMIDPMRSRRSFPTPTRCWRQKLSSRVGGSMTSISISPTILCRSTKPIRTLSPASGMP